MKYNKYVIVYNNKKLSGFDGLNLDGDILIQHLRFKKNDYVIFPTIEEAQKYIDYVISNVTSSQKSKAIKLTIREDF